MEEDCLNASELLQTKKERIDNLSLLDKETHSGKGNICNRMFKKMGKGSLRGSVFNLAATTLGAGTASTPVIMGNSGFLLGSLLLIGGSLTCICTLNLLIESSKITNVRDSYHKICERAGGKLLANIVNAAMIVSLLGTITAYLIICMETSCTFIEETGISSKSTIESTWSKVIIIIVLALIAYPVCIMKKIDALKYAALLSIITLSYLALVILIETPFYLNQNYSSDKFNLFRFDMNLFDSFALTFFSFGNTSTFYSIYQELNNPISRRIKKVVNYCVITCFVMYFCVAAGGYLSQLNNLPPIIVNEEPLKYFSNVDYFMTVGKFMFFITVFISIAIVYFALRRFLYDFYSPGCTITNPSNLFVTFILLSISAFVGCVFPYIISVMSIIGGFAYVITCYIAPTWIYVVCIPKGQRIIQKILSVILCISLVICGYISVGYTTYKIATGQI